MFWSLQVKSFLQITNFRSKKIESVFVCIFVPLEYLLPKLYPEVK